MPAYLDFVGFKARSTMPDTEVDRVEAKWPGWILQQLASYSSQLDDQLAKRYPVPFREPVPEAIKNWLERIVTPRCYFKRGVNPSDEQFQALSADAEAVWKQVALAADSNTGLYDLPLRQDTSESGITKGGPLVHSEQSPYSWTDAQAEAVRNGE